MSTSDPDRTASKPPDVTGVLNLEIDRLADAFDRDWRDGKTPSVADQLLAAAPAVRPLLLAQLACIDLEYRWRARQPPDPARYAREFPDLWAANHNVAREIEEFAAELMRAVIPVNGDPMPPDGEIERINRLLIPPDGGAPRYCARERLGEGGMGTVYRAEQRATTPRGLTRNQVALKVIALGMNSTQVVARFEVEQRAMALMSHPGIAMVLDAGLLTDGRPYFAMEYVPGRPITEFADSNRLSIEARLRLFQQVCDAVQHAHGRGIIHRDLKPSNVVAYIDGDTARAKVIDFGLAKALGHRLTEDTYGTGVNRAIGTFPFMSPEQVAGDPDIDMRTDVYALGALLYELLAGVNAFDFERLGEDERRRVIRDVNPPRLATRLWGLGEERASHISTCRSSNPETLRQHLAGELAWIPLKAMKKLRHERYDTVLALRQDIDRYLKDEPLTAGPDSAVYRIKKSLRRNRGPVAVMAAAIVLFMGGAIWFAVNSQRLKRQAATLPSPPQLPTTQEQVLSDITGDDPSIKGGPYPVYENRLGMTFARIPTGTFTMGSPPNEPHRNEDEVQHEVSITRTIFMGVTEVTRRQWKRMNMETTSFHEKDAGNHPIHTISLTQIAKYCRLLSEVDKKFIYRLPSEAEWEYAARAGRPGAYCCGDDSVRALQFGWFVESFEQGKAHYRPVMDKLVKNDWGLYDMHGNVWEWVQDDYTAYEIPKDGKPIEDRVRTTDPVNRVARGGSFATGAFMARSAQRSKDWGNTVMNSGGSAFGFRLVAEPRGAFNAASQEAAK